MRKRYEPLPDGAAVFRSVRVAGGFLPSGFRLPKPEWLEPTNDDVAEAAKSGRAPGLSVWDAALAAHDDACWWRKVDSGEYRSFCADLTKLRQAATGFSRPFDIVADPLPTDDEPRLAQLGVDERKRLEIAAGGHSLAEGIKRPAGTPKREHKSFREELARHFSPLP